MSLVLNIIFWIAIALVLLKLYVKLVTGWCKSNVCLVGKTAIVTGANTGIGYETAEDFAKRGAKVILACRDEGKAKDAVQRIIKATDNKNVSYRYLDVADFKSVRKFAEEINTIEERLDILVNNAGVGTYGKKKSENGQFMLMQINYFGPFLLTYLLLDILKRTPNSRIVNVSSVAAKMVQNFDVTALNIFPESRFLCLANTKLYARSKLCNILFTIELASRLKGSSTTVYSVHPGPVHTDIFRRLPPLVKEVNNFIFNIFFKSPIEGAQTSIYCSVSKGIEDLSGQHFKDCHVVGRYKAAEDPELSKRLWKTTEKILNL